MTLRLPPHYGAPAAVKPTVGAPDRLEQIDVSLLWPSLETRNYRNDAEFDGLGTKVLKIEVHVLNRVLYEGRHVNNLTCAFEFATNEFGKDCFDPHAVPLTGDPAANLTPRYGLSRRGPGPKWMPSLETWFNLTEDGTVSTMVECPREGDGPIYGECKHSFEIPELNATVVTRYNGVYLPQWMEIQRAVTNIFLAMRR